MPIILLIICIIIGVFGAGCLIKEINEKLGLEWYDRDCCSRMLIILSCLLQGCIFMPIALALAGITYAVVLIPTMLFQFYRLFKIFGLQCCKTNDKKKKKKRAALP